MRRLCVRFLVLLGAGLASGTQRPSKERHPKVYVERGGSEASTVMGRLVDAPHHTGGKYRTTTRKYPRDGLPSVVPTYNLDENNVTKAYKDILGQSKKFSGFTTRMDTLLSHLTKLKMDMHQRLCFGWCGHPIGGREYDLHVNNPGLFNRCMYNCDECDHQRCSSFAFLKNSGGMTHDECMAECVPTAVYDLARWPIPKSAVPGALARLITRALRPNAAAGEELTKAQKRYLPGVGTTPVRSR